MKVSIVLNFMSYELGYFEKLLSSIEQQTYRNWEAIIIDKTDSDTIKTCVMAKKLSARVRVIKFPRDAGFAENYNVGIRESSADFVFVLNPDTLLHPECISKLYEAMIKHQRIGCVSPKILRLKKDQQIMNPPVIDSAGMYLTKFIRHFDRGAGELDEGQYNKPCYVFGVTGAGAFFRRSCLEDVKIGNQYFDEDFWSSREDADLSWRLQNYGWKCFYAPDAIMYHIRTLKPGSRSSNSQLMNMHGVKNRYLLLINNISVVNYLKFFPYIFLRDVLVLSAVLLTERSSLKAYWFLIQNLPRLLAKRRRIQSRVISNQSGYWFTHKEEVTEDVWS